MLVPGPTQRWRAWDADNWRLARGEVHVWRLPPERSLVPVDAAERRRAAQFVREEDRSRFVAGRTMVRRLLGLHLGCAPADLVLASDRYGRPRLASPAADGLDFNISHSGGCVLIAVALGRSVGADVEEIRPGVDILRTMRELFTAAEQAAVMTLTGEAREDAFFRYWTRKEAVAKAMGTGLGAPLATLDVRLGTLRDWEVRTLAVGDHYRAAVAAAGHGWPLACWDAHQGP